MENKIAPGLGTGGVGEIQSTAEYTGIRARLKGILNHLGANEYAPATLITGLIRLFGLKGV